MLINSEADPKPTDVNEAEAEEANPTDVNEVESEVESESESMPKYLCWNCNNTYSSKEYQIFKYCSDACEYEHPNTTCYCGNRIASDPDSREYQLCEEHADDV